MEAFAEKHYYEVIDYWLQNLSGINRKIVIVTYSHYSLIYI